jgi:uncharacterized protein YfdQ (DUF2303 family)
MNSPSNDRASEPEIPSSELKALDLIDISTNNTTKSSPNKSIINFFENNNSKIESQSKEEDEIKTTPNRDFIKKLLNRNMKVKITDGRIIIGNFVCTDKHSNLILGCCQEFTQTTGLFQFEI